jgi:ABC-2 type transport system permease protein
MTGFRTLLLKELLRFWKVSFQTIAAPILTALLYLLVFSHVLEERVQVYPGVSYTAFLIPGLAMMSLLQNAFANSSSSLIQSKVTGNIVFILLPPLSHAEFYWAYIIAAVVRGVVVGSGVFLVTLLGSHVPVPNLLWALAFAVLGGGILGALGLIAGILADKFDQLAAFQNFIVVPLTFRHAFFGVSDVAPAVSLAIVGGCFAALSFACLALIRKGHKLRH